MTDIIKKDIFSAIKRLKYMQTEEFKKSFDDELDKALNATDNSEEATQTVAQNYFHILKAKLPNVKICNIVIDNEEPYFITVNGKRYELDAMVRHNDSKNTELLMEIQSLWNDADKEKVQTILNELIS